MDLKICGLIDIILILIMIIAAILGFKKGFMKKVLSLVGIIGIIVFSWSFSGQFAQMLKYNDIIYPDIYGTINSNIVAGFGSSFGADATTGQLVSAALGIPDFLGNFIASRLNLPSSGDLIIAVSEGITTIAMNGIAFLILVVSLLLLFGIAMLVIHILKKNKIIKFVDGVLGMILYLAIAFIIISILFFILSLIMNQEWFSSAKEWLVVDMMLEDDTKFRLSKALYEGNIITRIITFIFGDLGL